MGADEGGGGRLEYRVEIWGEPPASVHVCVTFLSKQTNKQTTNQGANRKQRRRRHLLICPPVRDAECCGDETHVHIVSVLDGHKSMQKKKGVKQIISLTDG